MFSSGTLPAKGLFCANGLLINKTPGCFQPGVLFIHFSIIGLFVIGSRAEF
jgi:hypothetical protein